MVWIRTTKDPKNQDDQKIEDNLENKDAPKIKTKDKEEWKMINFLQRRQLQKLRLPQKNKDNLNETWKPQKGRGLQ